MRFSLTTALSLVILFSILPARADFSPPPDGKFTEAQLTSYLATQKDLLDILNDARAQQHGGAMPDLSQQFQVCLDKHQMSRQEFQWMQQSAADAWSAMAYVDGSAKTNADRLTAQEKQLDDQISATKQQLATDETAKSNGWRIVNPDQRDALVKAAAQDEKAARDLAARYQQDVQSAETDAQQHDADAKTADDEANNPPADIAKEDRTEYIESKKEEASAARESATEARVEEDEAKKNESDAQAQADAAAQRAAHPEIPITDDDKAKATADIDNAIAAAKSTLAADAAQKQQLAKQQADVDKTTSTLTHGVPLSNIDLIRKYSDEYKQQIEDVRAATRP
jgi:hypothetical protein